MRVLDAGGQLQAHWDGDGYVDDPWYLFEDGRVVVTQQGGQLHVLQFLRYTRPIRLSGFSAGP